MAKVAITEQYLTDIADAIRSKTGLTTATYLPSEMAPAIMTISGSGGIVPTGTINITSNGTYNVTQYASASVNVPTGSTINNQDKSVTPSETNQSITYDTGYTGLGVVTVGAISNTYVGSAIDVNPTITVGGATVTIPSGYYNAQTTKSVASGTAGTPSASKGTVSNNSITVTPSVTNTTGYITGGTKTGTAVTISASELVSGNKAITANGTNIDVTNYETVSVNVPTGGGSPTIETLTVTPSESEQTFNSSSVDGYKPVTVEAISSTYIGSDILRTSAIFPSSIGTHTDTYYVINMVPMDNFYFTEAAPAYVPRNYFGTATAAQVLEGATFTSATGLAIEGTIEAKSSADVTVSGATVSIPSGYYSAATSKSVASGTTTAPTSISGTAASVSTGTNTLTLTKTVSVTPRITTAGYISSGTAGNSSVSLTASVTVDPTPTASGATVTIPAGYYTEQTTKSVSSGSAKGPTSLSGSSATVTTGTNTLTLTKTGVTTTPIVSAGYVSSATASTATVALTASVTTKAAATITPTTINQTIASGTYLTGTQTIVGDADLVGGNILSTANIFGVQGEVVVQNVYHSSSAPSSSTGSNGDIYIQS